MNKKIEILPLFSAIAEAKHQMSLTSHMKPSTVNHSKAAYVISY